MVATLPPGSYALSVHAFSTVTNSFNHLQSVPITVVSPQVIIAVDGPPPSSTVSQPFSINGWAIHLGSPPGGTGVDAVHIYAIANGGTGAATFLGAATPMAGRGTSERRARAGGGGSERSESSRFFGLFGSCESVAGSACIEQTLTLTS